MTAFVQGLNSTLNVRLLSIVVLCLIYIAGKKRFRIDRSFSSTFIAAFTKGLANHSL